MPNRDRLPRLLRVGLILLIVLTGQVLFSVASYAQPPIGAFYYPPDNIPPGPPPNYNQVDTSYFMGEPPIPFPPPDSGGVYVWVDSEGNWNLANHIYSQGNSLEQFHGSVLAMLDSPPEPGVNVFATNFELWVDPDDPERTQCYQQNDRWGWYQWAENLYEIWWDVSTREWKQDSGDPNDFMKIMIVGCAIDFNVWSSGHGGPFDTDQIFLGSSMIRLSDVPGFEDTYPGIEDPYQSQAGDDPTRDPNITVFTPIEGTGASYNLDGIINSGQTYPCGQILDQDYGDRFAEAFVYEGNGIQFSSSCLTNPCDFNNAPIAVSPDDLTMIVCDLAEICLPGFSYSDPDGNLLSFEVTGGTLNGDTVCFNPVEGINTITLICVDECGAADTSITQVTVNLNQPPQIACPPDISIDCSGSTDPSYTGYPTVTDDQAQDPTITYSDVFGFYAITRTWIATDDCGSSAECVQTITLVDTTPPTITFCPDGFTVGCLSEIPEADINLVTAIDDCDPNPVVTHDGDVSDGNSCPETITRTYRVTDASGNSDVCVQIITVMDTTPPTITCPPGITIECGASIEPQFTGIPSAGDNCGAEPALNYADSQVDNIITRTWTATDLCGLSSSCDQIITLVDTTPPTITFCPDGFTVGCLSEIPEADINLVTVIDDCDPNPVVTHEGDVSDGNSCPETITRTYRITDASGNSDVCVQIITVMDTTPPTIICPPGITIECGGSIEPQFTGIPSAGDNCGAEPTLNYVDSQVDNIITRTWTATDLCGLSSSCDQIITLVDTTPPTITFCPDGFTVGCLSEIPEADINLVTVIDDCDPDPAVTHEGDVSDGNSCPETITRTYRVTDASGNSDVCVQIITVMDTTPPTITCPENLTISCSDPSDPDNTGYPTASDNCEVSEVTYSDVTTDELITRTWVAVDACGNAIDCEQLITIAENLPPIVDCPVEPLTVITLDLEDEICFTDIPHYDPDGELESVLVNGVLMTGTDICFVPQNWGLNQVTIVCVDECGASTECSFTVIVGACYFLPGDANSDGNVNVADVLDMLNHLIGITDLPDDGQCDCYPNVPFVPFYGGADANGSCRFNVADVIHLFDILKGFEGEIQYCPLCPPTEGWLPPLRGDDGDPKPLLNSGMKLPANN